MAIYHCSIKIGSRSKGQSAIAASAYRSGTKLNDYETGLTSDFTLKRGVIFSEISLCKNAPSEYTDREKLWNAVHEIEKNSSAQLWREFEVALPQELNQEQQKEAVRMFVKKLNEQGMCVDWSLHDKGDGNPHAHIMATMRSITSNGRWAPKSRKVYDLDENGERILQRIDKSGRKQYKSHKEYYNDWNAKERVEEWRSYWAECCNAFLSSDRQIDHRSYERQGIEQIPTIHEGYVARKMTERGQEADRVKINVDRRKLNAKLTSELTEVRRQITQIKAELSENKIIRTDTEKMQESKGLQKWADIQNMKEASRVINILTKYGVEDTGNLEDVMFSKYAEIGSLTARLNTINTLIEDWEEKIRLVKKVRRLQPIMDGRKGLSERKKAKYDSANSSDIAAYREAVKQLKVWYPNGAPTPEFMEEKKNELVQEHSEKEERCADLKSEVKELETAQKELEEYLSQERGQNDVLPSEVTEEHSAEKNVKALDKEDVSCSTKFKDDKSAVPVDKKGKKVLTLGLNKLKTVEKRVANKPREPRNNGHNKSNERA